jgi:hypothetical protein
MSRYSISLILLLIIIITYYFNPKRKNYKNKQVTVISSIDGSEYKVVNMYENTYDAANILAVINIMYVNIIKHLKHNKMNTIWKENIIYLANNYNPDVLQEHIPTDITLTSYVHNKGEKIIMCLRKIENRNTFYNINTLKFVAIHELAHMMTRSFGHENDFWEAFKFILSEASYLNMINIIDYSKSPEPYCGIIIKSSPIFE